MDLFQYSAVCRLSRKSFFDRVQKFKLLYLRRFFREKSLYQNEDGNELHRR